LFVSKRIKLRKMTMEDVERYHSWRNDVDVMISTNPLLDLYTLSETKAFVEGVILNSSSSKSYIIQDKANEKAIGITSLINMD
jgi:RimJ/RimL family protein N-acetyltransferase